MSTTAAAGTGTAATWALERELRGHTDKVSCCVWNPTNGSRLASASHDRTVRVWDIVSGLEVTRLEGHGGPLASCAYNPDGTRLASTSGDLTVRIWDVSSDIIAGHEVAKLEGHTSWVFSCAWRTPAGAQLASASGDTVRIWDVNTGREVAQLKGHTAWVRSCAWSAIGRAVQVESINTRVESAFGFSA